MSSPSSSSKAKPELLTSHLHQTLLEIRANPCPTLQNPPQCKKRASVALIVRVRPHPSQWPSPSHAATVPNTNTNTTTTTPTPTLNHLPPSLNPTRSSDAPCSSGDPLTAFFDESWVARGEPEVLFIKRAARPGDRWTSHVALPGGKRDPADEDDRATAIRETWEEVGLDLAGDGAAAALSVGNLPERVVTTSWGSVPLMVLCPFVFLLRRHNIPPLRLQGAEVSSAHWVPLRALLAPSLRTVQACDVSDRLATRGRSVTRWLLRALMGQMFFSAIRLTPSESVFDVFTPGVLPSEEAESTRGLLQFLGAATAVSKTTSTTTTPPSLVDQPLLLWGLTLGIIADFMEMLPGQDTSGLWTYPTFSAWDLRLCLGLLSWSFRRRKERGMITDEQDGLSPVAVEVGLDAVRSFDVAGSHDRGAMGDEVEGSQATRDESQRTGGRRRPRSSLVGTMLDGYYDIVRGAVAVTLVARLLGGSIFLMALWRWRRRMVGT